MIEHANKLSNIIKTKFHQDQTREKHSITLHSITKNYEVVELA